jgi:hypothetical protein
MKTGLRIAMAAMLVCGAVSPLAAQSKKAAAAPRKPPPPPKPAAKRPQVNPAKELDQFSKMSPEDREKALSKLPPQRRAVVEQRLARYQNMTPERQEAFKRQLEIMQSLPKDRQNAVRDRIKEIRELPTQAERRKALTGDEFKKNFSPDEQEVVREAFPNIKNLD